MKTPISCRRLIIIMNIVLLFLTGAVNSHAKLFLILEWLKNVSSHDVGPTDQPPVLLDTS